MMRSIVRSEEHTSELQSRFGISYAVFFFKNTAPTDIYTLSLHDALPISLERIGEHHPNLFLTVRGKLIDDAIDRARRRRRVQRAEHQVSRLGRLDGDRHRLEIAELADENDVGILTECRAQRALERFRVDTDLA